MPQIIFTDEERAEMDRLVAEYSPSNHPLIEPALGLLRQDVRDKFVTDFEDMLRAVAHTACIVLPLLDDDSDDDSDDLAVHGLRDIVNELSSSMLMRSEEILRMLAGQGDSRLSEACYLLSMDLMDEVLATRSLQMASS